MDVINWHQSVVIALVCAVLTLVLRVVPLPPVGRLVPFLRGATQEGAVVFALFAMWQIIGRHARTRVDGAFFHAERIWDFERALHIDVELHEQHLIAPHAWLVRAMNTFYLFGHLNVMIFLLLWLFIRHREAYPPIRNTLAVSSLVCLCIQTIPVAPPRMLTELGFVDTALEYGQSVYGPFGSGLANQLSAMPSLHEGWAVLAAAAVVRASTSRWRWLALAHPVVMLAVIAGTANHWVLDGVVAAVVVLTVLWAEDRRRQWLAAPAPASTRRSAEPDPVLAQGYDVAG